VLPYRGCMLYIAGRGREVVLRSLEWAKRRRSKSWKWSAV